MGNHSIERKPFSFEQFRGAVSLGAVAMFAVVLVDITSPETQTNNLPAHISSPVTIHQPDLLPAPSNMFDLFDSSQGTATNTNSVSNALTVSN
jgi:hypothetical protein